MLKKNILQLILFLAPKWVNLPGLQSNSGAVTWIGVRYRRYRRDRCTLLIAVGMLLCHSCSKRNTRDKLLADASTHMSLVIESLFAGAPLKPYGTGSHPLLCLLGIITGMMYVLVCMLVLPQKDPTVVSH